jgi:hypothetical protein
LKQSLKVLLEIKFPVLISVESKAAAYQHVVVAWREMVIDYESMYTYPLTEDTLSANLQCQYYLSTNQLWVWHLTVKNLQSITWESEYLELGHSRILQTRKFYKGIFLLEVTR